MTYHTFESVKQDAKRIAYKKNPIYSEMSLRDYFAAQALTGAQVWDAVINGKNAQFSAGTEKLAEVAFAVADAMMKAREA